MAILFGLARGEDRREFEQDVFPDDRSTIGAGDGERRLHVSEVGPLMIRSS
jgi:hypothetical protein